MIKILVDIQLNITTLSKQIWIKASAVLIIFPNIEKFGMQSKARPSISPNLFWTVQIFLAWLKKDFMDIGQKTFSNE